ncbi:MAG: DUF1028 domain-containing protein [Chitinophagaceae bacterium]|nr:MAG: DUF1028 domain-containing protein [Chitinophagaceae bacterium]
MKILKHFYLTFFFVTIFVVQSYATWSIIVVDPKTKEIGIAGASCTYSVYGIGAIAPGKGAIIVQAMSNNEARAKGLKMILADASPQEILKAIKDPMFDPEEQQYAIICVNYWEKPLTYTGTLTTPNKGALTAKGISVQGNTLTNSGELQAVLNAAIKAQKDSLSIEDVLMLALEAGAKLGGDKRCGDTKASSAFLTVEKPNDDPENPYLNLVVYGTDDTVNAVETLRKKFNNWKAKMDK